METRTPVKQYLEGKRRGHLDHVLGLKLNVAYRGTAPQNQSYYRGYRDGWNAPVEVYFGGTK